MKKKRKYECMLCGKRVTSYSGIMYHLQRLHNESCTKGTNYQLIGGSKMDVTQNIECLLCHQILRGQRALGPHFKKHEGYNYEDEQKGKTWEYTSKKAKTPFRKYNPESEKKYKQKLKRGRKIIAPNMQYIDVPAIIRIPISLGQVQIVSIEGS